MKKRTQSSERIWFLRRPAQVLADITVLCTAFFIAYLPAVNIQLREFYVHTALAQVPFVVLVQFSSLFLVGAYSILWRYIGIEDIKVFLKAALISGTVLIAFRFLLIFTEFNLWQVPISVILIDTAFAFGGLLALRIFRRFIYELREKKRPMSGKRRTVRRPTLLVGAGRTALALIKEIKGRPDAELEIFGFVDDDRRKQGGSVSGYKVLGSTSDLPRLVDELNIEQVVIALDDAQGKEIRRILDVCRLIRVRAQIMPALNEIATGRVSVSRLRDVQIEDLLGREPIKLDDDNLHRFLTSRTVMVTGAGGSIGSELVRQIISYEPKKILLVDRAEFALFDMERELCSNADVCFESLIADVGDGHRMREIFSRYRPEVIFHAAAHKHVPLMEANATEAIKNNVFATKCLAQIAGEHGATDFVLISTDKAVNPSSVMGASKRVAELVIQDLDSIFDTKYVAVRFGNVLGSAGSVVPIFREQIRRGEAITVTDPEMKRYFMTIPEASQLVLQAGALGHGGEILVLDMGDPVRILDLAEDMIRLSGLTPYEDIDIVFTGVRQGEKLFEELEMVGEDMVKTRHPKIFIGKIATYPKDEVSRLLKGLAEAVEESDEQRIRRLFNQCLPEAKLDADEQSVTAKTLAAQDYYATTPSKLGLAEK